MSTPRQVDTAKALNVVIKDSKVTITSFAGTYGCTRKQMHALLRHGPQTMKVIEHICDIADITVIDFMKKGN